LPSEKLLYAGNIAVLQSKLEFFYDESGSVQAMMRPSNTTTPTTAPPL
jgi:hypothetical protein